MKMKEQIREVWWQMDHVMFVSLAAGNYCLIVEGTALNDFVEDFLWDDYEFDATSVTMEGPASIPVYYNYLAADLPAARFVESLNGLDREEAERVFARDR
jgi:hypothetical protein